MKEKRKKRIPNWVGILLILGLIVLLGIFLAATGFFDSVRSLEDMRTYVEQFQPYSYGVYFVVQLASVVLAPIPSNVTSLAGAALFGMIPAFLLTYGAVAAGSALVFWLARLLGQPFVERFVSRKDMEKYMKLVERKQDVFFAMAFLLPGFPDDILCFLAGLTQMRFRRFLALVLLCRPWGLFVSCAVGGNALQLPPWVLVALCAAGIALFLLAMKYGDRAEEWFLQKFRK